MSGEFADDSGEVAVIRISVTVVVVQAVGLVVDVVPDDQVVLAGCIGLADGEDQAAVESNSEQSGKFYLTNLL